MVMVGLRGEEVGPDTHTYIRFALSDGLQNESWSFIYYFLRDICSLGNQENYFLMSMSILTYIPLCILVSKESSRPGISLLIFIVSGAWFFWQSFNICRQEIAIIFVLWSAYFICHHKQVAACSFIIIAYLFHPYTIIFLPFIFINKFHISYKQIRFAIIVSFIIGFSSSYLINDVLDIINGLVGSSSNESLSHFAGYANGNDEVLSNYSSVGKLCTMLPYSFLALFIREEDTLRSTYYKMFVVGAVLLNLTVSTVFCQRLCSTYTISIILALPLMMQNLNKRRLFVIWCFIIVLVLLYCYEMIHDVVSNPLTTPLLYKTCF